MRIRVLLADDHALVREAIRRALEATDDFEVVGEASSEAQVPPLVRRSAPHLLLLDPGMGNGAGLPCLPRLLEAHPSLAVVALALSADQEQVERALRLGARGYIRKDVCAQHLPILLRELLRGTVAFIAPTSAIDVRLPSHGLSEREIEVLRGVARGLTNQAIGRELWVSDQTVKFHLRNIYRKLSVANRTEAAHFAFQHGFVS